MLRLCFIRFCLLTGISLLSQASWGLTARFRCMWRDNPSTTMVVAWDQVSGSDPILYFDTHDRGQQVRSYRYSKRPDRVVFSRGMNNTFVRLSGLRPNTVYYLVVRDSEGLSRRLSFRTAPADPAVRLSLIAGGDSRNYREARLNANLLVAKLRPHAVLFGGDFTADDVADEWLEWFDDWQTTIAPDGRMFPMVVARGNHELSNTPLVDLFDVPHPEVFYAFSFGGNLLRIYTLNTMIAAGGNQRDWLERDLKANQAHHWRMVHYHQPMRPHTQRKPERDELVLHWAPLFFQYKVRLVVECDAHVVKCTWPIRPNKGLQAFEGFSRDDANGTVYAGEGGWGAPLRANNDDKPWTRSSGSFNQFSWIFVDRQRIEVRTVKTDNARTVESVHPERIFEAPRGLMLWNPPSGDVVVIPKPGAEATSNTAQPQGAATVPVKYAYKLHPDQATGDLKVLYSLSGPSSVSIRILSASRSQVYRMDLPGQAPGQYLQTLNIRQVPQGDYRLLVEANGSVIQEYEVVKR